MSRGGAFAAVAGATALAGLACGVAGAWAQGYFSHGLWRSGLREASAGALAGIGAGLTGALLLIAVHRPSAAVPEAGEAAAGRARRPRPPRWWRAALGLALALVAGGAAATLVASRLPAGFLTGPSARMVLSPLPVALYRFSLVPAAAALLALLLLRAGRRRSGLPRAVAWAAAPLALLMAAGGPAARIGSGGARGAPDVLLISIDTLRADRLGCYGYPRDTSPSLDRLAASGYRFASATSQAPNTDPSHASILTGLDPPRHGNLLNGDILRTRVLTLPEMLRERGYRTEAVVGGPTMQAALCGLDQGFDLYDDRFSGSLRPAGRVTDLALAALGRVGADGPLFLFVHYYDVHGPYDPPPGFRERFAAGPAPPERDREVNLEDLPEYQKLEGPRSARFYLDGYDGEIRHVDAEIARLLEGLEAAGRAEGAWVVVLSDHGESLLERPRLFHHGAMLTEEQILIPLIVRPPRGFTPPPGAPGPPAVVAAPVQSTDLTPFLLDATGTPRPRGVVFDGVSLLEAMSPPEPGAPPPVPRLSFAVARCAPWQLPGFPVRLDRQGLLMSLRTDRLKLVRYPGRAGDYHELYDLREDPGERRDIAGAEPEAVAELSGRLSAWAAAGGSAPSARRDGDEQTRELLRSLGYVD